MNTDKIIDFIRRRFHDDNHWTDGNCYWAAWILCEQFKSLSMYYCSDIGHFVAGDGNTFYDGHGQFVPEDVHDIIPLSEIKKSDPLWFERLMRDCRN